MDMFFVSIQSLLFNVLRIHDLERGDGGGGGGLITHRLTNCSLFLIGWLKVFVLCLNFLDIVK